MASSERRQKSSIPALATGAPNASNYCDDYSPKEAPTEFMQRSNVNSLLHGALLALLQTRPRDPISFLADYFGAFLGPRNKLLTAHDKIMMNDSTSDIFESNIVDAYKVLQVANSSKVVQASSQSSGVRGEDHNDLLMMLTKDTPTKYAEPLLKRLVKPDKQSISLSTFRNDVTTAILYQDYIKTSLSLYQDIDFGGKGYASRELCHVFLNELKALLYNETSHGILSNDFKRAISKHSSTDTQERNSMNVDEFIQYALEIFLRDS